ncbi:MAG: phytanoyl-CoA dioxygenase family protein [Bryobacteraceae bacterium]
MTSPEAIRRELDAAFDVSAADIEFFRKNGFVRIKQVFSSGLLEHSRAAISRCVQRLNKQSLPMEQRSLYDRAFLQVTNLWTQDQTVREFVLGRRLGGIAAALLGVSGVRLYHDQALYKEPGGGITPWHADQYYWPLTSDRTVTAWIPLQATPLEMGPVAFCPGSQTLTLGRDLEIGEESEKTLQAALASAGLDEKPFDSGEVSFHTGWTFHRAGKNQTPLPREVMTMIYMDENMRLAKPGNKNQILDAEVFCPGVRPGELIATHLNPVIFSGKL